MEFKKIKAIVEKRINDYIDQKIKEALESKERLRNIQLNTLNKRDFYKGTLEQQQQKTIKALNNKREKIITEEINYIKSIEEAEDFKELTLIVEWTKSRMWGLNPRCYTNKGFEGESISGCGYDKLSTATAQGLNSYKPLLKIFYQKYEEIDNGEGETDLREVFGYGIDFYFSKIFFNGGVGIESHKRILENIGLNVEHTSTKTTDILRITK